jgi:hypothetical protein
MINIKEILEKEGPMVKLSNVAPEGFILVHEKTLEDLKDFETWKSWKNDDLTIKELNNKNFE